MGKVVVFSVLLVLGLVGSQWLPALAGDAFPTVSFVVLMLTTIALCFIMIHVGYEFEIDKSNLGQYGMDYLVAFTAASFPWIFVTLYFVYVMLPADLWSSFDAWKETLLAGRFAAPTSAGVLFSMLAAAGLSATWLFRKARILAIFDDLDTVLLMIPLKMLMIGVAWQLGAVVFVMVSMLVVAYVWLHRVRMPTSWPWVLGYATVISIVTEGLHLASKAINQDVPIHIEVLLPAFALGCIMKHPEGSDPHLDDHRLGHQEGPESPEEQQVATIVSAAFMVLVGLSMPSIFGAEETVGTAASVTASQPAMGWGQIAVHVTLVTLLANLGKMLPAVCYRREAHWRERLALAIGMWPRGEVGAGVLIISVGYGLGGPIVTVAMLSLAVNLVLTGVFIIFVRKLVEDLLPPELAASTRGARPRRLEAPG